MGLQDVFQSAAITAFEIFSDVSKVSYYHSVGIKTYEPVSGTQVEAGAVQITEATDLSAIASTNSINSTTTDFTTYTNINTNYYLRISGFTNNTNNGFCLPVTITTNSLVVSGLTLIDEAAGDEITIFGNFIKLTNVIFASYSIKEKENSPIEPGDQKALVLPSQLGITPQIDDYLYRSDTGKKWIVVDKTIDPATAMWQLQCRK